MSTGTARPVAQTVADPAAQRSAQRSAQQSAQQAARHTGRPAGRPGAAPGDPSDGAAGWTRLLPRRLRQDPLARAVAALDPDPLRSALAVLAGVAALGCAVGLMATSAWLISRAAQHPPVMYLQVAVVATRAFGIGRGVLRYVERLISHDVALRGVASLRERLYLRLAAADPARAAGLRRGDLLARVGADVDALADLVVRSLLPFTVSLLTAAASAVLVAALLPPAGLLVGAGLAVAAVVAPWLSATAARRAERDAAQARSATSAEVLAVLDGAAELTVAGAVPGRLRRLAALDDVLAARLDAAARPAALAAAVATLATGLGMVGALWLAVRAVSSGGLDEVLLAVVALTPLAAGEAVAGLATAAAGLVRARSAAERVLDLLDAPPAAPAAPASGVAGARPAVPPGAHLTAAALATGWPGAAPTLQGFDLDLAPGRRVAVVGASGTGKTTLLLTLAGLLPPVSGAVTLGFDATPGHDGVPARPLDELAPGLVRRTVSFTAEDAHIFTTTVRENLRVAAPEAGDDDLLAALARAGLSTWAAGLPRGLDTMLGSGGAGLAGGAGLSGGEQRRLLLARALLVGAGVLLLDEPAEHLDPATADALVRDVLAPDDPAPDVRGSGVPGSGSRAVVVVTHRLAPLDAADEVLVLDGGRVTARGRHADLLAGHPPYRDAWEAEQGGRPSRAPLPLP